jgi:hypothetical protein
MAQIRKLYRSRTNRKLGPVCVAASPDISTPTRR